MNKEDIKVGEMYNVRVKVECIDDDGWLKVRTSEKAISFILSPKELEAFSALPKYDPCRPFRKGDKVRLCEYNGRAPFDNENFEQEEAGQLCIIAENEDYENAYSLHVWKLEDMEREPDDGERPWFAFPLMFMELITPVEELEPYSITYWMDTSEECGRFEVVRGEQCVSIYPYGTHETRYYKKAEHAKAAAEAECARLNAEYRKELGK